MPASEPTSNSPGGVVVFRPHRSTTYVEAAYCYQPSSEVCRSVCRSVALVSAAKTAEPIEMLLQLTPHIDNQKNLLNSNISPTCPHNMVNFGPLTAEIGSAVCGTPTNFNGFRVLAALLHGALVVGVSQTLRR